MSRKARTGYIDADTQPAETVVTIRDGSPGARIEDFEEGDIVQVSRTHELLRVVGVDVACSQITVQRALGSTAEPIWEGDEAIIVASSVPSE